MRICGRCQSQARSRHVERQQREAHMARLPRNREGFLFLKLVAWQVPMKCPSAILPRAVTGRLSV